MENAVSEIQELAEQDQRAIDARISRILEEINSIKLIEQVDGSDNYVNTDDDFFYKLALLFQEENIQVEKLPGLNTYRLFDDRDQDFYFDVNFSKTIIPRKEGCGETATYLSQLNYGKTDIYKLERIVKWFSESEYWRVHKNEELSF